MLILRTIKVYLGLCQTSMMERFGKIVNLLKSLIILTKSSIIDIYQGSKMPLTIIT